ncbi:MAG: reverse transcriptase family protein [Planctomycetota bacterium]
MDVRGALRKAQQRIQKRILIPRLLPSDFSFGCVRGRNIKMNAEAHKNSQFVFSCDITDFYPTIHSSRVYNFFSDNQGCSPDVARLLTRLCTYNHHLALGLITSPLIANHALTTVDFRIAQMASSVGLKYTRYVDDITISGPFDLHKSGFPDTIKRILSTHGFSTNDAKDQFGSLGDPEVLITKLRVNRGHLDISRKYFDEVCRVLVDLRNLGNGGLFVGPYYTSGQMWGRVQFISWVNPNRRKTLRDLHRSIPWKQVDAEAKKRGLIKYHRTLVPYRISDHRSENVLQNIASSCP